MVDLSDVRLQGPWGAIDLLAVIGSPRAVDVEAREDLRDILVDSQYNLAPISSHG